MKVKIADVIVNKRIRRNLGDLTTLSQSLKQYGLIHPIMIDDQNNLIAGERRLESAKKLGWTTIEAKVISKPSETDALELEIDENVYRKSFTSDELSDAFEKLDRLKNPRFFRKIFNAIRKFFSRSRKKPGSTLK
ncbi:MAG: ParB N-terminal domain-containing protein [Spirochaetales bacterium]|nr:ParB N-terminal domain-containing protein [Spirochaetales bacterium]